MSHATLLVLTVVLTWPQDTEDAKRAIAIVKKVDGQLKFDEKAPGRPVVGLNL